MGGIIHRVLGIIERVNVQIEFDPILFLTRGLAHARARIPETNRESSGFHAQPVFLVETP
jgi:hypothetical protein